jgi:hypothetical protein
MKNTLLTNIVPALIYLAPTIIARFRRHPSFKTVFAFNFLVGWTGIGWLICLLYALSDLDEKSIEEEKFTSDFSAFLNSGCARIKSLAEKAYGLEANILKKEQAISSILDSKFFPNELTKLRFIETSQAVIEAAKTRFALTVSLLKGLGALVDVNKIDSEEFVSQALRADTHLHEIQIASENLAKFISTISQIDIHAGFPSSSIEGVIEDLQRTIDMVKTSKY